MGGQQPPLKKHKVKVSQKDGKKVTKRFVQLRNKHGRYFSLSQAGTGESFTQPELVEVTCPYQELGYTQLRALRAFRKKTSGKKPPKLKDRNKLTLVKSLCVHEHAAVQGTNHAEMELTSEEQTVVQQCSNKSSLGSSRELSPSSQLYVSE